MPTYKPTISSFYNNDVDDLYQQVELYNNIFIVGPAGSGKTYLLEKFLNKYSENYELIMTGNGAEINVEERQLITQIEDLRKFKKSLLVIDEYELLKSGIVMEGLYRSLREGRKYGVRNIVISRNSSLIERMKPQGVVYNLQPLDRLASIALLKELFDAKRIPHEFINIFENKLDEYSNSPGYLHQIARWVEYNIGNSFRFHEAFSLGEGYHNKIYTKDLSQGNIILPEQKKLITDIKVINQTLLDKIKKKPADMYKLSSREFEMFVAEYFEKKGYDVELTPETRDGGKDIILVEKSALGKFLFYVECKRYAADNPVSVDIVRQLHGTVTADKATAGVIVTSSHFTKDAVLFSKTIEHQMSLIDYMALQKKILE